MGKQKEPQTAGDIESGNEFKTIKLVDRAASSDFEAFGELYSMYLDKIYRYVFYQVRNKMIAEDITEEAFVKAWKSIDSCKGKGHTFLSWLYRIAHNQAVDYFRSRQREVSLLDIDNLPDTSASASTAEAGLERKELLELIAALPQNQGQVINMKFIEGMDNREIARAMDKSQGAIRVLQMRALATLRQRLSGDM